jgi:hypothetical protein
MSSRYTKYKIINNDSEYYEFLRKRRELKSIRHYETPKNYVPSPTERAQLLTIKYMWKSGDRYPNLATKHYYSPSFWWVIAQYNGKHTEADIHPGDIIEIPVNLEEALKILRVY